MTQERTEWRADQYVDDRWRVRTFRGRKMVRLVAINLDEPTAHLIAAAPAMALTLTLVAEACEENLADHRAGKFLVKEWAPFLESTGNRAIAALRTAGRIPK